MPNRIISALRYEDGPSAIDFLGAAFGFQKHLVVEDEAGAITHAQLVRDDCMVMLSSSKESSLSDAVCSPKATEGRNTQCLCLIVDDPDMVFERAVAAGAEILLPCEDQHYGGRAFTCRDPEGHVWSFGSYDPWADA